MLDNSFVLGNVVKQFLRLVFLFLVIVNLAACTNGTKNHETSVEDAVAVAKQEAESKNFDISNSDIEALKFKKSKYERGPIRFSAIIRYFGENNYKQMLDNEYWIVYFYPKGALDNPDSFGVKDFYVLVNLRTGKVLKSTKGY